MLSRKKRGYRLITKQIYLKRRFYVRMVSLPRKTIETLRAETPGGQLIVV